MHKGGQTGNQNARKDGIYSNLAPLSESEIAAIADAAIHTSDTATLRKLTQAPAYRDQPEKRRALRRIIRAIIARNILATNPEPEHSPTRIPPGGRPAPQPRIAIGH